MTDERTVVDTQPADASEGGEAGIAALVGQASWRHAVRVGLIGAALAIYLCLVGLVTSFDARPMIQGVISLGQTFLLLTLFGTGYLAARGHARGLPAILAGGLGGGLSGLGLGLLVVIGEFVNLRTVFAPAAPALYDIITFGLGVSGAWIPAVVGVGLGALAGGLALMPVAVLRTLTAGFLALLVFGLFSGLLRTPMLGSPLAGVARFLFSSNGLTVAGALIVFVLTAVVTRIPDIRPARQESGSLLIDEPSDEAKPAITPARAIALPVIIGAVILVLLLPHLLGPFVAQVVALVAIYILMAFGLNITLGLAGLLDLGFVAFFAVGAYTVGLMTSTAEYGLLDWPFWAAVPFAVIAAMLFGAFLGLPILGIRGDYLAIATLGFGEIIRLLAGSDLLKDILGGPRGIINIPKPIDVPPDSILAGPNQIYYIALAFAAVVAFVAARLRTSRLGRAWIAIREDEDVAEALGINLINTKLLAYMLGAAFAGLGGAVFAGLVGSIFDSSINLFVSINVAAIIIIGGMGSLPGVVVGAIVLIGIPELFREFADYRFLFYGAALIVMMRFRPEGLLPSKVVQRELHGEEETEEPIETSPSPKPAAT
jgi:branched-chain amino acid transport system permease protein